MTIKNPLEMKLGEIVQELVELGIMRFAEFDTASDTIKKNYKERQDALYQELNRRETIVYSSSEAARKINRRTYLP